MKGAKRRILLLASVISMVVGIFSAIPSYFNEKYTMASISTLLMIGGLVLFAITFEED